MAAKTVQPVSLALETRAALPMPETAFHLNREQQTLRPWAMREDRPLGPRCTNGLLAWSVTDIKAVLGVAA